MSPFASKPTITGKTVVLRPIMADDAQDLDHVLSHPAVNRISLGALDFNEASRRALPPCGLC